MCLDCSLLCGIPLGSPSTGGKTLTATSGVCWGTLGEFFSLGTLTSPRKVKSRGWRVPAWPMAAWSGVQEGRAGAHGQ
jgi:hypothetical protein